MDDDIAIKVDQVSKKYCKSIKKSITYGLKDIARNSIGLSSHSDFLRADEFWAVDGVSFELGKGEALGIIGPNGSGKTTLLKLLNGIFWPDKGKISVRGKVGALIEVGAGFHPMLTGRENIYINAAILGMNESEVDEQLSEIIDFADIGDFIDAPVKTYSSGMFVRLGFAVAVHCRPNVLLVDEILAVGDRDFQIKCFRKMHDLKSEGNMSIILVTHNEYAIREFTQKCIVLEKGRLSFAGETEEAITHYINSQLLRKSDHTHETSQKKGEDDGSSTARREKRFLPTEAGIIKEIVFRDGNQDEIECIPTGQKLSIDFNFEIGRELLSPIFGISFYNEAGLFTGFWNSYEGARLPDIRGKGCVRVTIDPLDLPIDKYHCAIVLCEKEESNVLEWKELDRPFKVIRPNDTRGLLKLRQKWEVISP
jgi:ABC-type polysaccharide/polyol phosphate transport system ATPase subunit